jgi:hypothetical protein
MFTLNLDCGKHVAFNLTAEQIAQMNSHPLVAEYVWHIGLKNILQDSHASIVRDDFESDEAWIAAKRDRASLKLGALMTGEVRQQRANRVPKADDFTNFARREVLSMLSKEKRKELAELADKGAAYLDAVFAKNEEKLRPIVQGKLDAAILAAKAKAEIADGLNLDI